MSALNKRLIEFNEGLLPEKVQLKYEAMAENAFAFFRGTCHLFYEDLAAAEALSLSHLPGFAATCILKTLAVTRATTSLFILT